MRVYDLGEKYIYICESTNFGNKTVVVWKFILLYFL